MFLLLRVNAAFWFKSRVNALTFTYRTLRVWNPTIWKKPICFCILVILIILQLETWMQYKPGYTWTGADSSEISEKKGQCRTESWKKAGSTLHTRGLRKHVVYWSLGCIFQETMDFWLAKQNTITWTKMLYLCLMNCNTESRLRQGDALCVEDNWV